MQSRPESEPDLTQTVSSADAELWNDPPPRPGLKQESPEDCERLEQDLHFWLNRNGNRDRMEDWDARLVVRLPLLSCLWGYDEGWYRMMIFSEVVHLSRMTGRHLSGDEFDMAAFYTSKAVAAASYDRRIIGGLTALLFWRGSATYRLPGFQPHFVRFAHPQATRFPRLSAFAWHSTRTCAYGIVACAVYFLATDRYQRYMTSQALGDGLGNDPVFKELVDDKANTWARLKSGMQQKGSEQD